MELSSTVFSQVLVMFLLIALGALCLKLKILSIRTSKQLTTLLLYVVNPLVVINAYNMPFETRLAKNLVIAFLLAILSHLAAMGVSYIAIRSKNNNNASIERFSIIYTNCGFMALPLIGALFGTEGVFYASAYITVFNLFSWTHGRVSMQGKSVPLNIKAVLFSPVIIAVFIGLILFFSGIRLPYIVSEAVKHVSSLNTPLAMLVTGITLMSGNIIKAFTSLRQYYVVILGNVVVPLICAVIYLFLPIDHNIILVNLVAVACPCAVTTLLFSTSLKKDVSYASNILLLSNIISIASIPLIVMLFQFLSSSAIVTKIISGS